MNDVTTALVEYFSAVIEKARLEKGGPGSGHFGHSGRPGQRGGSASTGSGSAGDMQAFSAASMENNRRLDSLMPSVSADEDDAFLAGQIEDLTEQMVKEHGYFDNETFEELNYDYISDAITDWEIASDRGEALFLQVGVAQEFDVPLSDYVRNKIERKGGNPDATFDDEKKLSRLLYDETQDYLTKNGFSSLDTVVLYRGSTRKISGSNVTGNTLEAWTTSKEKAEFYVERKRSGVVLATEIPISSIFSMPQTGLGVPSAKEVVIIGTVPHPITLIEE